MTRPPPDRDPTLAEYLAALRTPRDAGRDIAVFRVRNTGATWRTLIIEPWATTVPLPPRQEYDVILHGIPDDPDRAGTPWHGDWPTLAFGDEAIVLEAANHTDGVAVFENGQLVWRW